MIKRTRKKASQHHHRHAVGFAFFTIAGIAMIQAFTAPLRSQTQEQILHDAATSTYVVCHAMVKPNTKDGTEQYFCSTEGCYSDGGYDVKVIGTYPDEDTCAGIAGSLQEGIGK